MGKKGKYYQKNQQQDVKKKKQIISQQHLMDKTHMQNTSYLPYLQSDTLYPPYIIDQQQKKIIRKILKQLNYILYLQYKNFWATLLYNPSFKICIHTCIQYFHRKWLNIYKNRQEEKQQNEQLLLQNYNKIKNQQIFQYTQALMKIILFIFYRIVHCGEENWELTTFYNLKHQIVNKYILDFPRILEIIEIYGPNNKDIVKVIVSQFTGLSSSLYSDFKEDIIQPLVNRMNKNLNMVKKTTDRQQFGIEYHYKRNIIGELSPGEQQLKKKICLLMQFISFYQCIKNIQQYFPSSWGQCVKFNLQIHNISQNVFIQIQKAYKAWNNHQQGQKIYPLMNCILKYIVNYFIGFLQRCDTLFILKKQNSNYKQAYIKCLDRMIQHYGRRQSLGKKMMTGKRSIELYIEILKIYPLDQFLGKLYTQQFQNSTYGINMDFLVDFKFAIDQEVIKKQKLQKQIIVSNSQQNKQILVQKKKQQIKIGKQQKIQQSEKKQKTLQNKIESIVKSSKNQEIQNFSQLQILISKRNRDDDYYQKLYKDYHNKITAEYEDQYDDLVDYEKRPMFQDNQKQQQKSSDDSSGEQYNSQTEKLHLVNSQSNSSRTGVTAHQNHQKYNRKNKIKFIPVEEKEVKTILNKNKTYKEKVNYVEKQNYKKKDKIFNQNKGFFYQQKQYQDQSCYQQIKNPNKDKHIEKVVNDDKKNDNKKTWQKRNQDKRYQDRKNEDKKYEDKKQKNNVNDDQNEKKINSSQISEQKQIKGNNKSKYNKPKGMNSSKKPKYVAKY